MATTDKIHQNLEPENEQQGTKQKLLSKVKATKEKISKATAAAVTKVKGQPTPPSGDRETVAPIALEFQPDAIEIEDRPVPKAARWMLYTIITLIVFGVLWASLSSVDQIVTARGKLTTLEGTMVIQPLETSTIREINVEVGDVVRKGDLLVRLDPTFPASEVAQLQASLESIVAQIDRLEAELKKNPYIIPEEEANENHLLQAETYRLRQQEYEARLRSFQEKISHSQAALDTNLREQKDLEQQRTVLLEIEEMFTKLHASKYGSKLRLLEAQDKRLAVESNLNRMISQAEEIKRQLASQEAEKQAFVEEWSGKVIEELVKLRAERNRLSGELSKANRRNSMVHLIAPADAVVLEIAERSVGSVVREAEELVTLVPLDAVLEGEVDISTADIGRLKAGNLVRIKLDAFPFQKHGIIDGEIRTISENTVQGQATKPDSEGNPVAVPQQQQQPVYRVQIKLTKTELRNMPKDFRLLPGMTLTAEIKVGDRNVMSYFLYPILKGLDESIREP